MKKYLTILCLLCLIVLSNSALAETDPCKCFDMGFATAVKAYNAGDKSMFDTSTGGISQTAFKKSPCCQNFGKQPLGCMGYMAAFKAVLLGGPNKNNIYYIQQYDMVKRLQLGF